MRLDIAIVDRIRFTELPSNPFVERYKGVPGTKSPEAAMNNML